MRILGFLKALVFGSSAGERRFGIALLLLVIGLGVFLRSAGGEWRRAVPERMEKSAERFEREGRQFGSEADREKAQFKSVRVEHFVRSGMYWAALVNLVLAATLLVTRRWWWGRDTAPASGASPDAKRGSRGRFWLWVGAAVLLALVIRWPRMDLSLYNDEAYNFRQYIHGKYKPGPDGEQRFQRAGWIETMWENKANNGVLFSAVARLFDDAWRPGDGSTDGQINERALRWGALVPGLLSIAAVGLLGRQLFGLHAGLAAAFLLAVHPWHLRYSTEARAYGLVMLFVALAMLFLVLALRDNRWRWWLAYGACQFLYMWAYAGALYFAVGINVAALLLIIGRGKEWRAAALGRFAVAGLLSAMVYLQLMAPCLPQMAYYIANLESLNNPMSLTRVINILSFLVTGMPLWDLDPGNPTNPALAKFWPGGWWMLLPALAAAGLLALVSLRVFKVSGLPRMLLFGNVLALVLAFADALLSGKVLHYWYVIYALPFVALFFAAGWAVVWKSKRLRPLAYALPVMIGLVMWRPLRDYRGHSKEAMRDAVELAREGGALIGGFWSDSSVYAPEMRWLRSADDLREMAAQARAEGRDLSVVFAHRHMAVAEHQELVELTEGRGDLPFAKVAVLHGLEESQTTTFVYRLESGVGGGSGGGDGEEGSGRSGGGEK